MFALLTLVIGALVIVGATRDTLQRVPVDPRRRAAFWLAGALGTYGLFAFFAQMLAASGALWFVPQSFEWPVGSADQVVSTPSQMIVPVVPSGRVQLYDTRAHFVRGWFVEASGGDFKPSATPEGKVEIFTARRKLRLVYSSQGEL